MVVPGATKLERLFKHVVSLDLDKSDIRRYEDFIIHEIEGLLIRGQAIANANDRDVIEPHDLPITKGLQEAINDFRKIDPREDVKLIIAPLAIRSPPDVALSDETVAFLPEVAGSLSVAIARLFKIIEPELKNPQTRHWEQARQIFDLLL